MRRRGGVAAVPLLLLPAASAPSAPVYAPQQIGSELAAKEQIGRLRAGLLCLPKSALRWRDIGVAERLDQRQIVADALEGAGLSVATVSREVPDRRVIQGTVTAARFDMCEGGFGSERVSGSAALEVTWRIGSADGKPEMDHVSRMSLTVLKGEARTLPTIYRSLLTGAAQELAAWLKGQGG